CPKYDDGRIKIQFRRVPLQPVERPSNHFLSREIRPDTKLCSRVFRLTVARCLPQYRCLHDSGNKPYTVPDLDEVHWLARHILVVEKLYGDGAVSLQIVPCFGRCKPGQQQYRGENGRFHGVQFYTLRDFSDILISYLVPIARQEQLTGNRLQGTANLHTWIHRRVRGGREGD